MDDIGTEKKRSTPIIHPETGMYIKKTVFISVSYIPGLSEALRRTFHYTGVQVISKGNNILKTILRHPMDEVPLHLKQNVV